MKKIIYLLFTLSLVISSCVNDAEVRVMPELNCKDTKVKLEKAAGSSFTALLSTTVGSVTAQYDADWLSVDVNSKRAIYTALTENKEEAPRIATVKLVSGSYEISVTVRQESQESDFEEPATLTVNPATITLEGASGTTAITELVSNKTEFSVVLTDDSWLSYAISGTTLIFTSKSKNTTNATRSTIATVTAGAGQEAKSVDVTVNQEVAVAGSATLTLSANAASMFPDAVTKSEKIIMTSSETEFSVTFKDKSWVKAEIDAANKTIYFWTLSPNLTGTDRKATVTVTAGSGTDMATQEVEITQKAMSSNEFAVGQIIADAGSLKGGIVFWVNAADRRKAKIMSLDRELLAWSTATPPAFTGTNNDDGLLGTQALSKLSYASEIPPVGYCMGKGTGWYWTARADLEQMFETYNGTTVADATNAVPDEMTDFEKANRAAWDKVVTDAGGTKMNEAAGSTAGDTYWVIRESSDGSKAFFVRLGQKSNWSASTAAKANQRYVRAVRSISK